jgi:hypothetical protein
MARRWIQQPSVTTRRHTAKEYAITFTVSGRRNDKVKCFVQETHEFHLSLQSTEDIIRDCKQIAEAMRARIETYLDPMCMCSPNPEAPCPVDHKRKEEE